MKTADSAHRPVDAIRTLMHTEFKDWKDALPVMMISTGGPIQRSRPHPEPVHPGGLPRGWTSHAVLPEFLPDADLYLIRRAGGGAGLLRHERDLHATLLLQSSDTLVDLDEWLHERYPPERDDDRGWPVTIRTWVRHTLLSLYDRSDPDEAAEQTLFALSGHIRTLPRAAF